MIGVRARQGLRLGISLGVSTLSAGMCHADELTEKVLQTFREKPGCRRVAGSTAERGGS